MEQQPISSFPLFFDLWQKNISKALSEASKDQRNLLVLSGSVLQHPGSGPHISFWKHFECSVTGSGWSGRDFPAGLIIIKSRCSVYSSSDGLVPVRTGRSWSRCSVFTGLDGSVPVRMGRFWSRTSVCSSPDGSVLVRTGRSWSRRSVGSGPGAQFLLVRFQCGWVISGPDAQSVPVRTGRFCSSSPVDPGADSSSVLRFCWFRSRGILMKAMAASSLQNSSRTMIPWSSVRCSRLRTRPQRRQVSDIISQLIRNKPAELSWV